ncbi:hypothetical protein [Flavobacterium sp.]|uniref:hypothetical protein n=1 Tax=Flavobacterium sp. TaxID=239 RepID=UPI00374D2AF6
MIKTKTSFIIFSILSAFTFPYLSLLTSLSSDYFSAFISIWNTTIYSFIPAFIKFLILIIITFLYWKLSTITFEINRKKFFTHLLLSIPGVLFSNISVYKLLNFHSFDSDSFLTQIQTVIFINTFINILFLFEQILFVVYYIKYTKTANVLDPKT